MVWKQIEKILNAEIIPSLWVERVLEWLYRTTGFPPLPILGGQRRREFVCDFCRHLSLICRKRLSLPQGLRALAGNYRSPMQKFVLLDIWEEVQSGMSLSTACASFPRYFSPFFCQVLRAGERADRVGVALEILYEHHKLRWARWRRATRAFTYPILLLAMSALLYAFILIFLLPRFEELYASVGAELPLITRAVVAVFANLRRYLILMVLLLLFGVTLAFAGSRIIGIRRAVYGLLHRLPLVGAVVQEASFAMFCSSLRVLLSAGVPLPDAVEDAAAPIKDIWLQDRLLRAVPRLEKGESLAAVLETLEIADSKLVWQLRLGQWREQLPETLHEIADSQHQRQRYRIRLLSALEPMAIITVGIIQACVAASIYLPLFNITKVILGFHDMD